MPSGLIFVTGATGFIGSTTALRALERGYHLRLAVRKESQIPALQNAFAAYKNAVSFVVIPDITSEAAYAGKLDGSDYIFHVASPLPGKSLDKNDFFGPAVNGTLAILKEASRVESIKRVVITSSVAALLPLSGVPNDGVISETTDWDLSVDPNTDFTGPNDMATAFTIYNASKLLSNQASWSFMSSNLPSFALSTIHPTFVWGYNPLQTTAQVSGTNGMLWGAIMTGEVPFVNNFVNVDDVAGAHLAALEKAEGNKAYLLSNKGFSWEEVKEILDRRWPQLRAKLTGSEKSAIWLIDSSRAEKELGLKWKGLEETVKEVVEQQLGFVKQAGQAGGLKLASG